MAGGTAATSHLARGTKSHPQWGSLPSALDTAAQSGNWVLRSLLEPVDPEACKAQVMESTGPVLEEQSPALQFRACSSVLPHDTLGVAPRGLETVAAHSAWATSLPFLDPPRWPQQHLGKGQGMQLLVQGWGPLNKYV